MQVVMLPTNELIPYEKNPRKNEEAVKFVANSIEDFGFQQPIVVDSDNVIIAGHTRWKAAKRLRLKEVPVVRASELTPEQVKAYRLADNKVAEAATWDIPLLAEELTGLIDLDIDMSRFDFNFQLEGINDSSEPESPEEDTEDDTEDGYYGSERERTADAYLLYDYDPERTGGKYQMPTLLPEHHVPARLIGFNYLLSSDDNGAGVHFFLDDYQFERIWNNPHKYLDKLVEHDCVLTPDFSLYLNMPMAMKIWNVYRSRLIGQMLQDRGAIVIPTLSWAEPETFDFCFDGLPKDGTVAVSTIGVKQDPEATAIWEAGMNEAIKRLEPRTIVIYGGTIDFDYQGIETAYIENEVAERWKNND